MKIKTVAYKGSKRKLLENIEHYASEIGAQSFFDGFSGTGIVSAHMRHKGYRVTGNDLNYSSYIYGSVFLNSFDTTDVLQHLEVIRSLDPVHGWITENYSGTKERVIRGTGGRSEHRPLGFIKINAMKIDAAREYIESLTGISNRNKHALIFSVILASDKVFNNSNDQKSSLKKWHKNALADIAFTMPTHISGPVGKQLKGDLKDLHPSADLVYYDPPYTHGVLYPSCYHLNDSIATWSKPDLDYDYAVPRPKELCFRKNGQTAGSFYSKREAQDSFRTIIENAQCQRLVLSYSDAPRNTVDIETLVTLCGDYGKVRVETKEHRLCTQFKSMNKVSQDLKEFFIIIDKS
jgi:adenine-specific DNA methylase